MLRFICELPNRVNFLNRDWCTQSRVLDIHIRTIRTPFWNSTCRFLPAVYRQAQLPFAAISHRGISGANSGDLSGPLCELCDQTPWPQHEATNILEHLIPRIFSDGNLVMLHDASVYVWKTTLTTLWIYSDHPWWLFPLPAAKLKLRLTLSMAYLDLSHFWVHQQTCRKQLVTRLDPVDSACLPSMRVAHSQVEDSKPQFLSGMHDSHDSWYCDIESKSKKLKQLPKGVTATKIKHVLRN